MWMSTSSFRAAISRKCNWWWFLAKSVQSLEVRIDVQGHLTAHMRMRISRRLSAQIVGVGKISDRVTRKNFRGKTSTTIQHSTPQALYLSVFSGPHMDCFIPNLLKCRRVCSPGTRGKSSDDQGHPISDVSRQT